MEKRTKKQIIKYICSICLFSLLMLLTGREKAQAEEDILYNITFSGYSEYDMNLTAKTRFALPEIPQTETEKYVGWYCMNKGVTKSYPFGTVLQVGGNVTFFPCETITYKVTFLNNSGTGGSSYDKINQSVELGSEITLPAGPKLSGYQNVGWTTVKGSKTPMYEIGSKYKVTKNTTLYIVRKRAYTVTFANGDGSITTSFKKLKMTVLSGTVITLPDGPVKTKSAYKGWATTEGATNVEYMPGSSYTIKKDTTFYGVYVPYVTLKYMSFDGSQVLETVKLEKGSSVKLKGYAVDGYTMMGWSKTPNQSVNAQYKVGQKVTINLGLTVYASLFDKKKEINYSRDNMPQYDRVWYTKVIVVGDSRTYWLEDTLRNELGDTFLNGVSFVALKGSGLDWLKGNGYNQLMKEIGEGGTAKKPVAVIFNSGINDLSNVSSYIAFMKKIQPELEAKECLLYYMTVNPVNNVILKNRGLNMPEETVRSFNSKIKTNLCSNGTYKYIDTHTELYATGCGHANGLQTKDDGLHYTRKTYKHIYAHMIKCLNRDAAIRAGQLKKEEE